MTSGSENWFGPDLQALVEMMSVGRRLAAYAPERDTTIGTSGNTLARRIILRKSPDGCAYFHEWRRSDPDDLHNHPWDSVSFVLTGGYWEITKEGRFWRAPGSIVFRRAEDFHRIEIRPHTNPCSLFITSVERQKWGFETAAGFIEDRLYREMKPEEKAAVSVIAHHHLTTTEGA